MAQPKQPRPGEALIPEVFVDDPDSAANPQPRYQRLLDRGPVFREELGVRVVDAGLVSQVLRNPRVFQSGGAVTPGGRPLIPLQVDPPEHRRYRQLLDPLFASPAVVALQPQIIALTAGLLDRIVGRERCDAMAEFCVPLPAMVLLALMGLPRADLPELLRLKDASVRLQAQPGAAEQDQQAAAGGQLHQYFAQILAARHDRPSQDLISQLLDARVDGQRLTDRELLDICVLLVPAGTDPVANTLGCALAYLAGHPEQRHRLATDPSVVSTATDEFLRWISPTALVGRVASEDTTVGGCPVRKGELVTVLLGAANAQLVPDGDHLDLFRRPNPHLAFGTGIHRCLGAHLAHLELRVALRLWHRRIPDYQIAPGAELSYDFPLRTLGHLPLVLGSPTS